MTYHFFDSSALVKRYHDEVGTDKVDWIIDRSDTVLVIFSLAISEVTSALCRKRNEGKINENMLTDLLAQFYQEVLARFILISLDDSLLPRSAELILSRGLRTLDSLQLAAILSIAELLEDDTVIFICADRQLAQAAESEGLTVLNLQQ